MNLTTGLTITSSLEQKKGKDTAFGDNPSFSGKFVIFDDVDRQMVESSRLDTELDDEEEDDYSSYASRVKYWPDGRSVAEKESSVVTTPASGVQAPFRRVSKKVLLEQKFFPLTTRGGPLFHYYDNIRRSSSEFIDNKGSQRKSLNHFYSEQMDSTWKPFTSYRSFHYPIRATGIRRKQYSLSSFPFGASYGTRSQTAAIRSTSTPKPIVPVLTLPSNLDNLRDEDKYEETANSDQLSRFNASTSVNQSSRGKEGTPESTKRAINAHPELTDKQRDYVIRILDSYFQVMNRLAQEFPKEQRELHQQHQEFVQNQHLNLFQLKGHQQEKSSSGASTEKMMNATSRTSSTGDNQGMELNQQVMPRKGQDDDGDDDDENSGSDISRSTVPVSKSSMLMASFSDS